MESSSAHESQGRGTPDPIAAGALLPAVSLPSVPSGAMVDLRGGRGPQVLIVMHSATCTGCTAYVRALLASQANRLEWGERLVLVVPALTGSAADLARLTPHGRVLADPDRRIACGEAMVVIADEWGEVYFLKRAGAQHDFPAPVEIGEWARFIAIQCPECESPEGEWRTI